ncbi:MAG: hypothetical protein DRP47_12880 [Candidatus Zixiibacteriota bacterium]|nr:MAG: hypothetical protein DRP47_12880 [candidate division Zixibacteria bacterium]
MKLTGKVVIELDPLEVERLLAVLMDEDREGAYRFLKECLEKKIQDRLRPHCVPVFEVSYNPRQKDPYAK